MFSHMGIAAYKADLGNTIELCAALGDPHLGFRSIHVAGTNGKGSVSHMLAAILQQAGYRTGLYTSPHLKDFRERIRIDGEMVDESFVVDFTKRIKPLIGKIEPSFFEITVAMAFSYFVERKVDIAVIETGLGGRLDSTNVIHPELSIITNVGWDHMNILGDSLEKIAAEKAGIIKQDVPVVIGELSPDTAETIVAAANNRKAPISIAAQKRQVTDWRWSNHLLVAEVNEEHSTAHHVYELDLAGIYQLKNLLTVLEACTVLRLRGWEIEEQDIKRGLRQAKKLTGLHGRWETIHEHPTVIVDVAHNKDGMRQLVQQMELTDHRELHIIIGMVKDKEIKEILALLPRHAHYYFTRAQIPRALPENELAHVADSVGLQGETLPDVNTAVRTALARSHADDLVIVCGSVFLAGEVDLSRVKL